MDIYALLGIANISEKLIEIEYQSMIDTGQCVPFNNKLGHTDKWRANHSEIMKGRPISENTRQAIINMSRDYMQTAVYKNKMSLAKRGKAKLPHTKKKLEYNGKIYYGWHDLEKNAGISRYLYNRLKM